MNHVATLLLIASSASTAVHACELLEPEPVTADAFERDAGPEFCSVDTVTLDVTDACPAGQRCEHGSPPDIGWNVGVCVDD